MKTAIKRLLLAVIFSGVSAYMVFLNIGDWLSISDPPQKADIIICLSGTPDRITKSAQLYQMGLAAKIMVMNRIDYQLMLKQNISPKNILEASWLIESTYQEGIAINRLLSGKDYTSALVVSDPYHLYRVKWTLQQTLKNNAPRISFISSNAPSLDGFWWKNDKSRIFVLSEIPKIVYYWIWHGMLGIEDDPAWATVMERKYVATLTAVFRFMEA